MIELSFSKLLLLAVIALVVLGPEKLPKAARMAGAMLRRLRLGWESVRSEVERELEIEEIRRNAREAVERAESMQKSASDMVRSAHASANEAVAGVSKLTANGDSNGPSDVNEAVTEVSKPAANNPAADNGEKGPSDGDA